jgi:paraquat-inducible protein B
MSVPEPHIVQNRAGLRLVWIVPIVAAIVGISLLVSNWRERGPRVSITFESGDGLEVGKTLVKYRDVTIGRVSQIKLNSERTEVEVIADLVKSAEDLASEGTRFWVVRPRFGVGWVSGLSTLLSGAYISVEGGPTGNKATHFTGLEVPPPLPHSLAGKRVVLGATELGSVNIGAPVYFHRFKVGEVIDEYLDEKTGAARIVAFIDAPHDQKVNQATRFWNASGIDINVSADGVKFRSQSLASVLAGGIAFEQGSDVADANATAIGTEFLLYKDEPSAMAPPDGEPRIVRMRFEKPLRGLTVGAPVEFVGVEIGSVTAIDVGYEHETHHFPVFVTAKLFPRRMGLAYTTLLARGEPETDDNLAKLSSQLVANGLRVQPHVGSLLTGRLYLGMDFVPSAPKVTFNAALRPVQLPTLNGNLGELQSGINKVIDKINALPLKDVVTHANEDLVDLHGTFQRVNAGLLPTAITTLSTMQNTLQGVDLLLAEDSPFRGDVRETLDDLQGTLRSVRALADTLNRHPEALIRGRPADAPDTLKAQAASSQ